MMTVEVLPTKGSANFARPSGGVAKRKMGLRFSIRWIIFVVCLCGTLFYLFQSFYFKPQTEDPRVIVVVTLDPLVVDIHGQVELRKASSGDTENLIPVDPNAVKTVLFWTAFFGAPDARGNLGAKLFDGCPVKQCSSTNDKGLLESSDAVIFHALDIAPNNLPRKRSAKQHFVFLIGESPANVPQNRIENTPVGFFDMTYTYRLDSDIIGPYMYSVPLEKSPKNFAEGKTKLVGWFVSNCETKSRREDYVKQLRNFIPVDIYGKCGSLKCSRNDEKACNEMLGKTYKFYLSFENSICKN